MLRKSICLLVATVVVCGLSRDARAAIITFDATITGADAPEVIDAFVAIYGTPSTTPALTFETQGYRFGGFGTAAPTPSTGAPSQPELFIMFDPSMCAAQTGNPLNSCAESLDPLGPTYLFTPDPFAFVRNGGNFAFSSFQATQMWGDGICYGCGDGDDLSSPSLLRVTGFRSGQVGFFAQQVFTLTPDFQSFTLTDPGWLNTTRVVFEGLDGAGNVLAEFYALDSLNVTAITAPAVPEPASLLLLGTGLAGLVARRRLKRRT